MNVNDLVRNYIQSISSNFAYEETSEMGYRTAFETLIRGIFESINVKRIGHDDKAKQGNKPDFVVMKNDIPILYIEAKDIGVSLDKIEKSEQMTRYYGYTNLVLTDYVEFRFYRNGEQYGDPIVIATYDKQNREIRPNVDSFEILERTFLDFAQSHKEPIKSGSHLAKIMGGKGQRIRDNVIHLFDNGSEKNADLVKLYEAIRDMLVRDLTTHTFADMYAQTLVYGLFVARYHDKTQGNFSRREARELIPNSNRLLRHFFDHIVGVDFKNSLKYIVDELCEVFSHADVEKLVNDYFKTSKEVKKIYDPVIHFYEDFLNEYDPKLRKKMGAYYTPQPVVDFIIKSTDEILKTEFNLSGISDTSKLKDGRHRVQILDPATGTGTFISTIIRDIYIPFKKSGQEGRWPAYVHNDLLPRLHGFELMMAPYTIAHLRLGIAFKKTGFWDFHRRLGIYLTNTLEEGQGQRLPMAFGLAESIAEESKEALVIKNETPIMVVVGNPPYSGISSNETKYANNLVKNYKVEPGGKQRLQERKHWLNDDYVKFIAFAESMIEKTGDGIVAMITNNGYLDNPTFRGMRWHLAKTFDRIYVLDLHGNAKKKETTPDGNKDENVFDIMQGVGIILAVKTGKKIVDELGVVHHAEIFGTREHKFNELTKPPKWQKLTLDSKMVYFKPKETKGRNEYERGISLDKLFVVSSVAAASAKDDINFAFSKSEIDERMNFIQNNEDAEIRHRFNLKPSDSRDWTVKTAKRDIMSNYTQDKIIPAMYRPFDTRYTFYSGNSRGIYSSPQKKVMHHIIDKENVGLGFNRKIEQNRGFTDIFVFNKLIQYHSLSIKETNTFAPLYLYNIDGSRTPNFNQNVLELLTKNLGTTYTPEDILDYIYAVLHSPRYREKYNEFLKADFPRVPEPKDAESFRKLVELGRKLRHIHLLETPEVNKFVTTYPESGSDVIEKPIYKDGNVYINDIQYFGNVPEVAWNFYIGGYQPAQKWLKDRKGRTLSNEDLEHYQKIIVALVETKRIMKEIDLVIEKK